MKEITKLNNEDGSVLVLALVMLVLLTLIGISATTTSMIENKISGNERVYKRNLYAAEAASMHCAQDMEGIPDPKTAPPPYLHPKDAIIPATYDTTIRDVDWWTTGTNSTGSIDVYTRFLASSQGLAGGAQGTSLDMTVSNVHAYSVYGRCEPSNSGPTIIEIGYRKAF